MKRVLKFATGDEIPSDAVYLKTVVQTVEVSDGPIEGYKICRQCYFVWHYFLVQR